MDVQYDKNVQIYLGYVRCKVRDDHYLKAARVTGCDNTVQLRCLLSSNDDYSPLITKFTEIGVYSCFFNRYLLRLSCHVEKLLKKTAGPISHGMTHTG